MIDGQCTEYVHFDDSKPVAGWAKSTWGCPFRSGKSIFFFHTQSRNFHSFSFVLFSARTNSLPRPTGVHSEHTLATHSTDLSPENPHGGLFEKESPSNTKINRVWTCAPWVYEQNSISLEESRIYCMGWWATTSIPEIVLLRTITIN